MRHTFASNLLSAGFALEFISRQLGHASVYTTAKHYAKWLTDEYREPPVLAAGDLPCDWLACADTRRHTEARGAGVSGRET
jgi:hypothetical protein